MTMFSQAVVQKFAGFPDELSRNSLFPNEENGGSTRGSLVLGRGSRTSMSL